MRSFSDNEVLPAPHFKVTTIASGAEHPKNEKPPVLFYRTDTKKLFIGTDQWYQIPFGDHAMHDSYRSASKIDILKGDKISIDGGTYLVDTTDSKKIQLPPGPAVVGIMFYIKNIGDNSFLLVTGSDEVMVEGREELCMHPGQCVGLKYFKNNWYIITSHMPSML